MNLQAFDLRCIDALVAPVVQSTPCSQFRSTFADPIHGGDDFRRVLLDEFRQLVDQWREVRCQRRRHLLPQMIERGRAAADRFVE